jgi:hypothetical protein
MTRALPFTEHGLRRAMAAARKEGYRVTGIRPDGTLIVRDGTEVIADNLLFDQTVVPGRWEDVEA